MGKKVIIIGVVILIAVIAVITFLMILPAKKCDNEKCFNSALENCKKAEYMKESEIATWQYIINGKTNEECRINVRLLMLKQGKTDIANWEGKEMSCYLPLRYIGYPEEKLNKCHGLLKEEIQETIIKKNHNYVLDNINKITEELNKPV